MLPVYLRQNQTYTFTFQAMSKHNAASALTKTKNGAARAVVWWGERLSGQFEVVVEKF